MTETERKLFNLMSQTDGASDLGQLMSIRQQYVQIKKRLIDQQLVRAQSWARHAVKVWLGCLTYALWVDFDCVDRELNLVVLSFLFALNVGMHVGMCVEKRCCSELRNTDWWLIEYDTKFKASLERFNGVSSPVDDSISMGLAGEIR